MSEQERKELDAVALQRRLRQEMSRDLDGMSFDEEKRYYAERIRSWRSEQPQKSAPEKARVSSKE